MAQTPKKAVHWNMASPSLSILDSPYFDTGDESSIDSTSSLDFINSQLVAHGFVDSPGLTLGGMSKDDSARLVKCMLALLGQRVQDMSRTEDLTTKLRTLTYDKERLESMHRSANDKCANAERETNMHKSRLTAAQKQLQASESSTKQANVELQRTRTMLQGVRATHAAELKKKEKEVERVLDKWQKLADSQAKLGMPASGIRCANAAVVEGNELLGKGHGFLEIAIEQAEQARVHLDNENLGLRKAFVRIVNEMQWVLYQAQSFLDDVTPEPTSYTMTTLFPLAPPDLAVDKSGAILLSLRDAISKLSKHTELAPDSDKVERLQVVISELKEELAKSQKESKARVAETQEMFNRFSEDQRIAAERIGDISVELMSAPLEDPEKERIEALRQELDGERQRFTDAALRLGKDKASLEAERLQLLEEKRAWQVEKMLAEMPPTPAVDVPVSPLRPSKKIHAMSPHKSPHKALQYPKSPRRSPAKNICVGKAGSGRKAHRVSRRSLASPATVLSYETEVIPPIPTTVPLFPSLKLSMAPTSSLLPTSFVLPPASPRASLPTNPALAMKRSTTPESPDEPETYTPPSSADASPESPPPAKNVSAAQIPETPAAARRPFPVAKPFAQRMIHAYSPAKPSPLSRMLMLTDSPLTPPMLGLGKADPLSPTYGSLPPVVEDREDEDDGLDYIANARARAPHPTQEARMSATELGIDSPPDSPLQEKKVAKNVSTLGQPNFQRGGRVFHPPDAKKPAASSATSKGKARAVDPPPAAPRARSRTSALGEKENTLATAKDRAVTGRSGKISPLPPVPQGRSNAVSTKTSSKSTGPLSAATSTTTARARVPIKLSAQAAVGGAGTGAAGPRRVPINSVDAPPINKGWKG